MGWDQGTGVEQQADALATAAVIGDGECIVAATSGTAQAQGHPRLPVGNVAYDIPASVCGFPIHVAVAEDKEYIVRMTQASSGSTDLRVTGTLTLSLTNTQTGHSINYNAGGPGSATIAPDGSFTANLQGHILDTHPEFPHFGLPALLMLTGTLTASADASGALTSLSLTGAVTDGCAALS